MISLPEDWTSHGVYTPNQAARLLGIQTAMIARWVYGNHASDAAIIPQHPEHNGRLITFLDLVQSMAIRAIRRQKKVSLQKIRKTVLKAQECGVPFPFATKHRTFVFADDVVLRLNGGELIQVTGKYQNNSLLEPIVYEYLEDIGFDDQGLAHDYKPIRRAHRSVILSPSVNYGAPSVMPCRYTVSTLLDAVESEGNANNAASACGVHPIDVELAIQYEEKLAA